MAGPYLGRGGRRGGGYQPGVPGNGRAGVVHGGCGEDRGRGRRRESLPATAVPRQGLQTAGKVERMAQSKRVELDETDRRILDELTRDARQSVTALAATVHISRAHAYERIRRLHEQGVVLRYTAVIDPAKAGLEASAYVTLRLKQNTWDTLGPKLRRIPQVQHVALVGGTFDVMLLVRARGTGELRDVIFERIQPMPEVVDTQTFLIFEDVDVGG